MVNLPCVRAMIPAHLYLASLMRVKRASRAVLQLTLSWQTNEPLTFAHKRLSHASYAGTHIVIGIFIHGLQ